MNSVTLNKKKYPCRITMGVLRQAEEMTGNSYLNPKLDELQVGDLLAIGYYGLKKGGEFELSFEEAEDLFNYDSFGEVLHCYVSSVTPEREDEKK